MSVLVDAGSEWLYNGDGEARDAVSDAVEVLYDVADECESDAARGDFQAGNAKAILDVCIRAGATMLLPSRQIRDAVFDFLFHSLWEWRSREGEASEFRDLQIEILVDLCSSPPVP